MLARPSGLSCCWCNLNPKPVLCFLRRSAAPLGVSPRLSETRGFGSRVQDWTSNSELLVHSPSLSASVSRSIAVTSAAAGVVGGAEVISSRSSGRSRSETQKGWGGGERTTVYINDIYI